MAGRRLVVALALVSAVFTARVAAQVSVILEPPVAGFNIANTSGLSVFWIIRNQGSSSVTIWTSCSFVDRVTSCSVPASYPIPAGSSVQVVVTYATGTPGVGRVALEAHTTSGSFTYNGGSNRTVQSTAAPTSSSISINPAPHNGDYRDVSKCVADCFDATLSYTTPAYFSMDSPRSVTLVYRSSQAKPLGFVQIDATDNTSPAPDKMSILLKRPDGTWVTFTNGSTEIFYWSGAGTSRLAAQFDATALATGAHDYTVVARSWRSGSFQEATSPIRVLVANEISSIVGAGWSISGHQKLSVRSDASVVLTEGDGSIAFFKVDLCPSNCNFLSPPGDFSSVVTTGTYPTIAGYTRRYPDGTLVTFSASGLVTSVRDRFANQTTYAYDASSRLSTITDPAGKVITFTYAGQNGWFIQDPGGRYTQISTGAPPSDVFFIWDPMSVAAYRPFYDAAHRMTQRIDRRGSQWGFAYDFAGKLAADTMPTITADGQSVQPVMQFISPERAVLVDPGSGLGTSANPAPRVLPGDVRASITNPRGFSTQYALDRFGATLRIEGPLARTAKLARNAHSQITADTSPSGNVVEYTWSGPRLTKSFDRTTGRTINMDYELTYNEVLKVYSDIDTVVNVWSAGKLTSTRRSNQPATTFTYDAKGRVLSETDPLGHVTSHHYAATGWQNSDSVVITGRRTAFTYDAYGRRTTIKDPENLVVTLQFDSINRNVRKIGPISDTTTIDYDSLYVRSITDPIGQRYQYIRNALGWIEARTDPGMRQDSYTYDKNGNRKQWLNRRGQTVSYTYDALDQLTGRTADGSTIVYQIDPGQRFRMAASDESTDTLKFDVAGRPESEITVLAGTRYERKSSYDIRGLRTALEVVAPWSDTVGFRYNANMLLDTLIDFRGERTKLRYNADLALDTIELPPPGLLISLTTQPNHVISQITYPNDQFVNSLVGLEFQPDARGLVFMRAKPGLDTAWITGHDPLGRVSNFLSQPFTFDSQYTYDKVGNRLDLGRNSVAGNRLTTFIGDSLFYDADGNLTKRRRAGADIQRLYWNSIGQLYAVWTSGRDSVTFAYDGFGRRVRKSIPSGTVRYIWDGDDLLAEVNGSGARLAEYAFYPGADRPHSIRRDGATGSTYYYAQDFPGNVVAVFGVNGGVPAARYRYSPFGTDLPGFPVGSSTVNTLRFAARPLDFETGLYYVRERYYDPQLSRFISEDPAGLQGGINQYVYAGNDPINLTDGSGQWVGALIGFVVIWVAEAVGPATVGAALITAATVMATTAMGAAVAAGVESFVTGQPWTSIFWRNFDIEGGFLASGVLVAAAFGGGYAGVGTYGLSGYVKAKGRISIPILNKIIGVREGGLTMGSATGYANVPDPRTVGGGINSSTKWIRAKSLAAHEFGHTIQFVGLSALGRIVNPWIPYGILGVPGFLGWQSTNPWENLASGLGNLW